MNERLPLHILPTFVIAARLENLRATAQRVSLTHGAVSQQIQLLEQAIGYPLFERSGRGVRLNAAGANCWRQLSLLYSLCNKALTEPDG